MESHWHPDASARSEFLSPSLIVGGRGTSAAVAELIARRFGITGGPVLVAVDDVVLANGLAKGLLDDLAAGGYDAILLGGFGAEPAADVVDAAAEVARESGAGAVIGVGGGSVLDSSKLIALLLRNGGRVADWLGPVDPPEGVAPLLLVPTTCGTGSEATRIAMVTVEGAKRAASCAAFVPGVVVIDPDLVRSLPGPVVASTAMDALAHAVESLMSTAASPMSAFQALRAIELLIGNVERAAGGDPDALAQCLWGSHLAGQALNAGVVVGHSLAYCLAYEHPMAHGTSCALALPYCIAYNSRLDPALGAAIAGALTGGRSSDLRIAAGEVLELVRRLGLPSTLADVDIAPAAEAAIAHRVVTEYPRPTNPEPLDEGRLGALIAAMRTGDLDAAFAAVRSAA
jgi:alcohol dehydrogenase class IV